MKFTPKGVVFSVSFRFSNSTTTLTGPVSWGTSNGFLEQACRDMGSRSLIILHVGLGGEAGHDVLHAQPLLAQHAV